MIYVVIWHNYGSECGIIGAYQSLEHAERMLAILKGHGDREKEFRIEELQVEVATND